jgi:ubiquinone/menaquinone biosynthesis C-methylase UbiE
MALLRLGSLAGGVSMGRSPAGHPAPHPGSRFAVRDIRLGRTGTDKVADARKPWRNSALAVCGSPWALERAGARARELVLDFARRRKKDRKAMDRVEYVKPSFPPDAFAGTASYYVRYRVPYPERFLRDLVQRSGLTGEGRLLDLACGPGRLALALISSFREIWAIDLEPEMIEAGRIEAARMGAGNIRWIVGRAENLDAPRASFELVTAGEAFHRLDQQVVATKALRWLKPGGHLATLGCYSILSEREPWQRIVMEVVLRWTKRASRDGDGPEPRKPGIGPDHDERVLSQEGFADVASYPTVEPHDWTIESILGYLYSTSTCSRKVLGAGADEFEADLRAALVSFEPAGIYREGIQWGFTIGRKPGPGSSGGT